MPRGVYERKERQKVLPDRLRSLADQIERELAKVDEAEKILERFNELLRIPATR